VLSDSKQSVVSKKQSFVFLQQLKLFLNFNHEQKEFKADDTKRIKNIFNQEKGLLQHKLRTNKGKSYPYVKSSMSHVLYDQEALIQLQ